MEELLGQALRRLRKARGMTQAALAAAISYDKSLISHVEHGVIPSPEFVVACDDCLRGDGLLQRLFEGSTGTAPDVDDDSAAPPAGSIDFSYLRGELARLNTTTEAILAALAGIVQVPKQRRESTASELSEPLEANEASAAKEPEPCR